MDGRKHEGAFVVMNSPAEGEDAAAWSAWYIDVHMPEVLDPGVFTAGARFERTGGRAPSDATHMALYECPREDIEGAWGDLRSALAKNADPNAPRPASDVVLASTFRLLYASPHGGKPTKSVLLVNVDYADEEGVDDFNQWYNTTHISEFLSSGAYHTAIRYEICEPVEQYGRFLAVYESELGPDEADRISRTNTAMSPAPEALKLRHLGHYARLK